MLRICWTLAKLGSYPPPGLLVKLAELRRQFAGGELVAGARKRTKTQLNEVQ
jgi:hypothetical protein